MMIVFPFLIRISRKQGRRLESHNLAQGDFLNFKLSYFSTKDFSLYI